MGEMLLNGRLYGASGIRELTQAQYDALPASKLTDGILYCIKDTGIVEGDKYAPVIYSLEEREIGVWTDGKPLYEITKFFPHDNAWDGTRTSISHGIQNIDNCVSIDGCFVQNGNIIQGGVTRTAGDAYTDGTSKSIADGLCLNVCAFSKTNFSIILGASYKVYSVIYDVRVTFRYTKTTDVPGSGTWGTDGVPMVHYDGNEKVIGTWFGETLYEKTIACGAIHTTGSHSTTHGIQNIKRVVKICGNCVSDSNMFFPLPLVQSGDILAYQIRVAIDNTNVILSTQSVTDIASTFVTVQYTKTS